MRKKTGLQRVIRGYFRLPEWLRPAIAGGVVLFVLMLVRVAGALPGLFAGRGSLRELLIAVGAATGAGIVGGLVHGLTRPPLRRLGRLGNALSGVALLYGYLGSLLWASPYVFERSARPDDAQGWWLWLGMATVLGLFAGFACYSGNDGFDRLKEQRSQPQVQRMVSEHDQRTAVLVSGWIRAERVEALLDGIAHALGARLTLGETARVVAALRALPEDDEDGLEWTLGLPRPVLAHFELDEQGLVAVGVLLEGEHEPRAEEVQRTFAAFTVDPLAASAVAGHARAPIEPDLGSHQDPTRERLRGVG